MPAPPPKPKGTRRWAGLDPKPRPSGKSTDLEATPGLAMPACELGTAHTASVSAHGLNSSQGCCSGVAGCRGCRPDIPIWQGGNLEPRMPFARKQGGGCQAPRTGLLWSMLPGPGPRLGRPTPSRRPLGWRSPLERWGVGTQAWGLQGVSRAALARSLVGTGAQHSHSGIPGCRTEEGPALGLSLCPATRLPPAGAVWPLAAWLPARSFSNAHSTKVSALLSAAPRGRVPARRISAAPCLSRGWGAAASHVTPSVAPHVPGLALSSQKPG